MVFQNYALYPHMSVFENMAYGLKIAKVPKDEIKARVDKAAKILELGPTWSASRASSRAASASAWPWAAPSCASPRCSCSTSRCPTWTPSCAPRPAGDPENCTANWASPALFVTHDQVEAMTLAQRMIVMNAGVMEQFGTPEEVYTRPATTFVASFIGSPPMNLLRERPGARPGTIMGIRPEHLDVTPGGWACAWRRSRCWAPNAWSMAAGRTASGDEMVIIRTEEAHMPCRPWARPSTSRRDRTACTWFDDRTGKRL
jgi:sn-glycerol 3-phosphate transport system ATP-binding protein